MDEPVLTTPLIKLCGLMRESDVDDALAAGASALGVILAPSTRRVTPEQASHLCRRVAGRALSVAVFRQVPESAIAADVAQVAPDAVQLHDPPSSALLDELRGRGCLVLRALASADPGLSDLDDEPFDGILLDGSEPGSGRVHDWGGATRRSWRRPLIAAGGLTSRTVREVASWSWVRGVDVSSGIERAPGVKDPEAMREFVREARAGFEEGR